MSCVLLKHCSDHLGSRNSRKTILMTPSDEQPDQPTKDSELSFSALEEQDVLVQEFRHFLQIELSKPVPKHISDVVADFSRRVTFLSKIFDLDRLTDDLASQIPGLSDAKMAELALDFSDSAKGRERPNRQPSFKSR